MNLKEKKLIFAGNRFFVLEEMIKLGLNIIEILAIENSYLEKELINKKIKYQSLKSKNQIIEFLENTEFDYFISNGLPFILPISKLKKENQRFINIHPSFLPDLKGADPQPAAIMFGRNSGATCHEMDDKIDNGDIISQKKIEFDESLDIGLLYQLSFLAEKEVFLTSYQNNFHISKMQPETQNNIYYSFKPEDLKIDFSTEAKQIVQKIKAFNNKSKGAYFILNNKKIRVFDAEIINNNFLNEVGKNCIENEIFLNYENKLIIKKNNCFLKLKNIDENISFIDKGVILE